MCESFAEMEELPDVEPIHSDTCLGKITKAGVFVTIFSHFSNERQIFLPWSSIIRVAYEHGAAAKKSRLLIQERSGDTVILEGITYNCYAAMEKTFAQNALEDTELKQENPQKIDIEENKNNFTLKADGIYEEQGGCCTPKMQTYVPWSKVDGLLYQEYSFKGSVFLITDTGHMFRVANAVGKSAAKAMYNKVRRLKYGTSGGDEVEEMNQPKKSVILTDQSVKLFLNGSKHVQEIDLERVIGARRGKNTHKELEIAVNIGNMYKGQLITVTLMDNEYARQLAKDIRERAQMRKTALAQQRLAQQQRMA